MTKLTAFLSSLILSTAMVGPVLASGNHSGGHGHDEFRKEAAEQHDDGHTDSGMHGHMGGHGHDDGHARSAVGEPGDSHAATRTIHVDLLDTMRFRFDEELKLHKGEVVRFVVTNKGTIRHEFSIGNESEQNAHRDLMRKMPHMVHEDANTVTVEPGQSKELTWKFAGNGPVVFACNIPGHSEAGMVVRTDLH